MGCFGNFLIIWFLLCCWIVFYMCFCWCWLFCFLIWIIFWSLWCCSVNGVCFVVKCLCCVMWVGLRYWVSIMILVLICFFVMVGSVFIWSGMMCCICLCRYCVCVWLRFCCGFCWLRLWCLCSCCWVVSLGCIVICMWVCCVIILGLICWMMMCVGLLLMVNCMYGVMVRLWCLMRCICIGLKIVLWMIVWFCFVILSVWWNIVGCSVLMMCLGNCWCVWLYCWMKWVIVWVGLIVCFGICMWFVVLVSGWRCGIVLCIILLSGCCLVGLWLWFFVFDGWGWVIFFCLMIVWCGIGWFLLVCVDINVIKCIYVGLMDVGCVWWFVYVDMIGE